MKHFLFEFITGGGLIGQALPDNMVFEARIMVNTLVKELIKCGHFKVSITKDDRVESFRGGVIQHSINMPVKEMLPGYIRESDICWLIAPESENSLYNLTDLFIKNASLFIGSDLNAVKIASSKLMTCNILKKENISTPDTKLVDDIIPDSKSGWIIKPNDGVGAESCNYIINKTELREKIGSYKNNNYIIQPYIDGEHMSMSLFIYNEKIQLLSCNKQEIILKKNSIRLKGIYVNEFLTYADEMRELAENIISVISGFSGYIGIDLVRKNNKFYVIDINPRFTTAYAGISASLGINVTEMILNTFLNNEMPYVSLKDAVPVKFKLQ